MDIKNEFESIVCEAGDFFEVNPVDRIRSTNHLRARDCVLYLAKRRLRLNSREIVDLYKDVFKVRFNDSTLRAKLKKLDGLVETDGSMRNFLSMYYEEFALKPKLNPLVNRVIAKVTKLSESDLKEISKFIDAKIEDWSWKYKK